MELNKIIPGDTAQEVADKIYDNDQMLDQKIDTKLDDSDLAEVVRISTPINFSIPQKYIKADTGELSAWGIARATELIPINSAYSIQALNLSNIAANSALIAFYKEDGTYIKEGSILATPNKEIADTGLITVPSDATQFRVMYNIEKTVPQLFILSGQYLADRIDNIESDLSEMEAELDNKVDISEFIDALKVNIPLVLSVPQKSINGITGELQQDGLCRATDFMNISPENTYSVKNIATGNFSSNAVVAFYDSDKQYLPNGSVILGANKTLEDTGILTPPSNSAFVRLCSKSDSIPEMIMIGNMPYIENEINEIRDDVASLNTRVEDLETHVVTRVIGLNKYNRNDPTNVGNNGSAGSYIDANGNVRVYAGNNNGGVTCLIPIFESETLVFPSYVKSLGTQQNYSALYDKYGNYIQGTAIQSNTLSWVEGAVYARFSGVWNLGVNTNTYYCYEISNPIQAWVPYAEYISPDDLPSAELTLNTKPIVMVGDSIAQGIAGRLNTIKPIAGREFYSYSVGGETCLDTLARVGCIPYVAKPFTIPADTSRVNIELCSSKGYGYEIDSSTGLVTNEGGDTLINAYGTLNCTINGIAGLIRFTRNASNTALESATFERLISGESAIIDKPAIVATSYIPRNSVVLCVMGTNQGWKVENGVRTPATIEDADNLVNYYKKLAEWGRPTNNDFVFLGFYETSITNHLILSERISWWNYFEGEMKKAFGLRYITLREYLITEGWKDAGITSLTTDDIAAINQYRIPLSIRASANLNEVHLSTNGYTAVANKILLRLQELGIINNVNKIQYA
ncbi:hypothetical protein D0T53_12895 [Dysgonomonas sp. 216]|uniref:hypothetical protein n=1 Tax=Dysgonomonas sp. 216 TaxID=2302934 RepID=UPI0013D4B0AA|nr:hypothetical protein [Dysgonomonas sp. 216]NDW19797.1 hypothetical protein [Dysgonomonas sp. 216]